MKVSLALEKHGWKPSPLPGQVVLVTTQDPSGAVDVAPKSYFAMAALGPPPVVMFGCNLGHVTARNALETRQFVINIPGEDLAAQCWKIGTGQAGTGSERFARTGLTPIPAARVRPPRIAECRAHLECEFAGVQEFGQEMCIFGRVVDATIDTRGVAPFFFLEDGVLAGLGATRSPSAHAPPRHVLTILAVSDLERSTRFYREVFGWTTRVEVPAYVEFELPDGSGLGVYVRQGFARNVGHTPAAVPEGAISGTEIYLYVDDFEPAIARIEATGARLLSARA
ncbi:MAG: flavin reductase, partial [Planctomycetes bacterium]|nr:flavin reductase [Planctomycetota bacterium]